MEETTSQDKSSLSNSDAQRIHVSIQLPNGKDVDQLKKKLESLIGEDIQNTDGDVKFIDPSLVRVKLTQEEKKQRQAEYRSKYNERPYVKADRERRAEDPSEIKRKQDYAANELVKARKKQVAEGNRQLYQRFKADYPSLYSKLKTEVMPPPVPRQKRQLSDSEKEQRRERKKRRFEEIDMDKIDKEESKEEPQKKKRRLSMIPKLREAISEGLNGGIRHAALVRAPSQLARKMSFICGTDGSPKILKHQTQPRS